MMLGVYDAFEHFSIAKSLGISLFLAVTVTSITLLVLWTRFTSGIAASSPSSQSEEPPSPPYWIPILRHLPEYLFNYEGILSDSRNTIHSDIFTLWRGREAHHIIHAPDLITEAFKKLGHTVWEHGARIGHNVYDIPKTLATPYAKTIAREVDQVMREAMEQTVLGPKEAKESNPMRRLLLNMPDLVTFNMSNIDLESWERISAAKVSAEQNIVEVSLLPLMFVFLTNMTTSTFLSEAILNDQEHEDIAPLLLAFVQSWSMLSMGLPRMIPHRTLPGAHITRRKLIAHLDALLDATDDPQFLKPMLEARRRKVLDDHDTAPGLRTSDLLRILYNFNMPHVLTFWMFLNILAKPQILDQVRQEVKKILKITQDPPMMGFEVPPRIDIDLDSLLKAETPVLDSCWLETIRVYSREQATYKVHQDLELHGDSSSIFKGAYTWDLKEGAWVDVPYWLANSDETKWAEPLAWKPNRHATSLEKDEPQSRVLQCDGSRAEMVIARLSAISFTASAITLFDFELDPSRSIPKPEYAAGVALPADDIRVRIRKRKFT